jgi:hypothetical protein
MGVRSVTGEYYKNLKTGEAYQDFISLKLYEAGIPICLFSSKEYQIRYGESIAGIEIKYDGQLEKTGNLYFETHEKSVPKNIEYVPSGILREDNSWLYGIGNFSVFFIIPNLSLQRFYAHPKRETKGGYKDRVIDTSMGFTLLAAYVEAVLSARVLKFGGAV